MLLAVVSILGAAIVVAVSIGEQRGRVAARNMRRWQRCVRYLMGCGDPPSDLPGAR